MSKLKTKDILYTITKTLKNKFPNSKIFLPLNDQNLTDNSFIVSLVPISQRIATSVSCNKEIMIDIKYISSDNDIIECYDVKDELEDIFVKGIHVRDRYIKIRNIEHDIIKDNYGSMLQYLIYIDYFDDIYLEREEVYEIMRSLNINIK